MNLKLCEIPFANPEYYFAGIAVYSGAENLENTRKTFSEIRVESDIYFVYLERS